MNADHQDAVATYARHYGGLKQVSRAQMVAIEARWMELEVDGQPLRIAFDHPLQDSEDAHRTLVAMVKAVVNP